MPFTSIPKGKKQNTDRESLYAMRVILWTICNEKKITLTEVQARTGLSYNLVYRVIGGPGNITVTSLITICKALEIQPRVALGFDVEFPEHLPSGRDFNI